MAIRASNRKNEPPPEYDKKSQLITVKIHHSGTLETDPVPYYEGGDFSVFDEVNTCGLSVMDLHNLCETVGVHGKTRLYCISDEHHEAQRILSDRVLNALCKEVIARDRVLVLYVVDFYIDEALAEEETVNADEDSDEERGGSESDSSSGEWTGVDSEYDEAEDDLDYDDNVDESVEWVGGNRVGNANAGSSRVCGHRNSKRGDDVDVEESDESETENDAVEESDDDFESVQGSDEENVTRAPVFNPEKDLYNPPLQCGLIFSNFEESKAAIKNWNIRRGRRFKFLRNDKVKVRAICPEENCNWMIYVRRVTGRLSRTGSVRVSTFVKKHTCNFRYNNSCVKSSWVAKRYTEMIRSNPKLDSVTFRRQVMKKSKCYVSKTQGYRARRSALKSVQGSEKDQYEKLYDYVREIRRSNPGSTVVMKMVDSYCHSRTQQPMFERLYVCFSGVKQGFLAGCRPIIGLDGTFIKGPIGGVLLVAVGTDPNNGFFPIAYAVAEGENKESWVWFLRLLRNDLQIQSDYEWTMMSDKQKGLIQACEIVFPNADHRFCVRHLHGNFSSAGFKGHALRKALWAVAKATTPNQFAVKMNYMASIDPEAPLWFEDKPPHQWSRAYFRTLPKCDVLLNNNAESFNSKIVDQRALPIVGMWEGIRVYIMERTLGCRERAQRWVQRNKAFCPKIFQRLNGYMKIATECIPHKCNEFHVEVWCPYGDQYAVNLKERTCTCRKWDLTGIPCPHAISAIWTTTTDVMDYVDPCYSVATYLKCYEPCILPLNGENEWEKGIELPPLPPKYSRAPGRPKKARRKSEVEVQITNEKRMKLRRLGQVIKCTYCSQSGHNRRSCSIRKDAERNETQPTQEQSQFEIHAEEGANAADFQYTNDLQNIEVQWENEKTIYDVADSTVRVEAVCDIQIDVNEMNEIQTAIDLGKNDDDCIQVFNPNFEETIVEPVPTIKKKEISIRRKKEITTPTIALRKSPRKLHVNNSQNKPSSQPLPSSSARQLEEKLSQDVQDKQRSQPHLPRITRSSEKASQSGKEEKTIDPNKTTMKRKKVQSLSQPQSSSKRNQNSRTRTKQSGFQLRDEVLPADKCPPLAQDMATSSSAMIPTAEPSRSSLWGVFGLEPPPFPVGCPPPLKNEKKSCTAVDDLLHPIVSKLDEPLLPSPKDPNVSKERLQGRLQGSKDIYTMFGLPVPKWIEDGLDVTFSGKAATENDTHKTPKTAVHSALKGKAKPSHV